MLSALKCTSKASFSFARFFAAAAKDSLLERVEKIIDERVRPALKMDGGDIKIDGIKDGVVDVTLLGHCSGCPSRRITLHEGILGCLQEEIPEIKNIRETMVEQ
ncbi:nifu-like protein [Tritrichomonas musculus]|uniref:Nifu-like protein n=1 Tax=Tritrichomonas musculus TaxID=1915356 RepID=A0ABR2K105_9EUKA